MPIKVWENGAILIYKGAKVLVVAGMAAIAAAAAAAGYKAGKKSKDKTKG